MVGILSVFLNLGKIQAEFRSVTMQDVMNLMKCQD